MDPDARAFFQKHGLRYARASHLLDKWQFRSLRALRDEGIITEAGYARLVASPRDGGAGKAGIWIGARRLRDEEVVYERALAAFVMAQACNGGDMVMTDALHPLIAPRIHKELIRCRHELASKIGLIGRLLNLLPAIRADRRSLRFRLVALTKLLAHFEQAGPSA